MSYAWKIDRSTFSTPSFEYEIGGDGVQNLVPDTPHLFSGTCLLSLQPTHNPS